MERVDEVPGLSAAAIKTVGRFHETMEALRDRVEDSGVAQILERVLNETGYLEMLAAERTVEAEGRAENLEALVAGAAEFDLEREREGESEVLPLEEYLQQISLYTDQDGLEGAAEELVTLMTLHNAKGLEYDTVFVVGCEDGAFPHMRALEEGAEEEERRLCYVAITRAERRLYMTWARERRLFGRADEKQAARAQQFVDSRQSFSLGWPVEINQQVPEKNKVVRTIWWLEILGQHITFVEAHRFGKRRTEHKSFCGGSKVFFSESQVTAPE